MDGVITALSGAIETMAGNCLSMVGTVLPLALPVVGAGVVVNFGLKIFKRVTGKA